MTNKTEVPGRAVRPKRRLLARMFLPAVIAIAIVLPTLFGFYAVSMMHTAASVRHIKFVSEATSAMAKLGVSIALVLVGLGVLVVCIRYAYRPNEPGAKRR